MKDDEKIFEGIIRRGRAETAQRGSGRFRVSGFLHQRKPRTGQRWNLGCGKQCSADCFFTLSGRKANFLQWERSAAKIEFCTYCKTGRKVSGKILEGAETIENLTEENKKVFLKSQYFVKVPPKPISYSKEEAPKEERVSKKVAQEDAEKKFSWEKQDREASEERQFERAEWNLPSPKREESLQETSLSVQDISDEVERLSGRYPKSMEGWLYDQPEI